MSVNKVILIGNATQDPQIRQTQDGRKIANFSIATSEKWKDKETGEVKEKAEFHKISVFNQGLIKVIEGYVKKGSKLYVEGSLSTRKWADKDGVEKYTTEIVLNPYGGILQLLGESKKQPSYQAAKDNPEATMDDDEIPF